MPRAHPLIVAFLALAAFAAFAALARAAASTPARPNIVYIMSDDHAATAIGAYGGRLAKLNPTPAIDRLAQEGMRFENVFATNSICTPSRACVITGQYNHVNQVYDLNGRIDPAQQVLAHELKRAGYQTAMIGKWHLTAEPVAFDHYAVLPGQGKYFDPDFLVRGAKPWPQNTLTRAGQHVTDATLDLVLDWLKTGRDAARPFFLMYHNKAPHDLYEFAPRYADYLGDVPIPEPESLWHQPRFGSIATRGVNDELWPYLGTSVGTRTPRRNYVKELGIAPQPTADASKRAAYQEYLKRYLRCVKGVDDSLAQFMDYLRTSGLLENTIVIYTSDQGMMLGEHDYVDKRWMYEESARMPFIVRYPGRIRPGSTTDAIVENVDFAPTLLDLAGIAAPASMQGRSFKSILETGREPPGWKQAAYYRYWMHLAHMDNPAHLGLRTKTHKLIFFYGVGRDDRTPRTPPGWELYDLKKDPHELVNVYDDPAYAGIVSELKAQLATRRRQIGDDGSDYPQIEAVVQEFWDYDAADRAKAVALSREYAAALRANPPPPFSPASATRKGKRRPESSPRPVAP